MSKTRKNKSNISPSFSSLFVKIQICIDIFHLFIFTSNIYIATNDLFAFQIGG